MRGRVSSFQLLLGIASGVFLGSESHGIISIFCLNTETPPTWRARFLTFAPIVLLILSQHGPRRKHRSSVAFACWDANLIATQSMPATAVVYRTITYQQLLYSCLFRCRCLTTGLHAIIRSFALDKKSSKTVVMNWGYMSCILSRILEFKPWSQERLSRLKAYCGRT
jgi:hypothetical protein